MKKVSIIIVDDEPEYWERVPDLVKAPIVEYGGETYQVVPNQIRRGLSRRGGLDLDTVMAEIQVYDPAVAIVDMRLKGDDSDDSSGVELAMRIKAAFSDCCVILVSAYFSRDSKCEPLRNMELFRETVDRLAEDYHERLEGALQRAVKTHLSSVNYRSQQFARKVGWKSETATMWGLVVEPSKQGVHLHHDLPIPHLKSNSVMVELLEAGVCGTDRVSLGIADPDSLKLYEIVDFHEAFGKVAWTGEAVRGCRPGDLVIPMVRRCDTWSKPEGAPKITPSSFHFSPCDNRTLGNCPGQADRCPNKEFEKENDGRRIGYKSRGTGKCHGFGSQYFIDTEDWLVPVKPPEDKMFCERMMNRYVLAEPLSIAWKMRREILRHHPVREYNDKLLVIGLGPIGLLSALVMKTLHPGLELTAVDLAEDSCRRVQILQKEFKDVKFCHADIGDEAPKVLKNQKFHIIVEATDQPAAIFGYAAPLLAPGGILVLLGIAQESPPVPIAATTISQFVRGGNTVIGSVNSSRSDFEDSIGFMEKVIGDRPSLLDEIADRWPIDRELSEKLLQFGRTKAKDRDAIKVVLDVRKSAGV